MEDKKKLIILSGPTAVGKTDISLRMAKRLNAEIISADSMQVYLGMDIGSAKLLERDREGIPHHLIDILDPKEEFNVAMFKELAKKAVDSIHGRGKLPIMVGGTGFYIQSLLYDIDFSEDTVDPEYRACLESFYKDRGEAYLYEILKDRDPEYAEITPMQNVKRVLRALEFHHATGRKLSEQNRLERSREPFYDAKYFVLTMPRDRLYQRIEARVDQMMSMGLLDEVVSLKEKGCGKWMTSMQGLGYKQLLMYLDGEITLEDAVKRIKQETRHFAKRQLTWFRREKDVILVDKSAFQDDSSVAEYLMGLI